MNGFFARVVIALLLAGLLWRQARAARDRPYRQRAFEMAAAALLAFAVFNGSLAAGAAIGPLQLIIAAAGVGLFLGSIVMLVLSLREGEMRGQRDRIASAAREYRAHHRGDQESGADDQGT